MDKKSFGLTEVIVGSVIIAMVFSGLMATFVGARNYVGRAQSRLVALNQARNYFSQWINEVRQDTWDTGDLSTGTRALTGGEGTVTVTDNGTFRQVTITINY